MTRTDHLAKAKDYIAKGEDFYRKAAEEIVAAIDEDGLSQRQIAKTLDRSRHWVQDLLKWHREGGPDQGRAVFGGQDENEGRYERHVKQVLKDPARRERAIAELPTQDLDEIAKTATEALVNRSRSTRSERDIEPTIKQLTEGEKFDPAEQWADALITRVWSAAHDLRRHVEKNGLVVGSMSDEQALENLNRAEADIAEVRAAMQERLQDRTVV